MMKNEPLISIIVPVYNVEEYFPKCIDSIINQTYRNLEIILVDDGSTDRSGIICDEYAEKDARIKVFHKANGGISSARNVGLDNMHGEFVGFVDADDWIEPDMFDYLFSKSAECGAQIATCTINANCEEKSGDIFQLLEMESAMRSLLKGGNVSNSVWDKLFSKSVLDGIRFPETMIMEDAATVYKCILNAKKVVVTGKALYHYRIRQGSTLHGAFSVRNFDSVKATKMRLDDITVRYPKLKQEAAEGYIWTALYCIWWADHVAHGQYNRKRKDIAEELLRYLKQNRDIKINDKTTRIKLALLRLGGLKVYDFVWNGYHNFLRRIGK